MSFSCGTLFTYYLQKNWTFQFKNQKNINVFPRFILAVICTYFLNTLILFIFVDIIHLSPYISKIIQILISTIWGYSINSIYVFKK